MVKRYVGCLKNEFSGYNSSKLLKDMMAGVTVAAVALPLALAFGISCGADAAAGLVTAIVGGLVMSLLSGTSFQISGPTGAMTAVLITVVAKFSLQGMFLTCLIAGFILLICGIFRLGRAVDYIPIPVITGFTSGIALVIALGQIDNFFGTTSEGELAVEKLLSYFSLGFRIDLATVLIGAGVVVLMLFWPKSWNRIVPSSLVGIIAATVAVSVLKLDIPTVGKIPQSIILKNRLLFGDIEISKIPSLLSPAFSVAVLAMIESLLCASSASRMKKESYDPDIELVSQGIGNLLLPFFGGVPATAAIARTSVAIKSGAQTRLAGVFHSLALLLCVLFISPILKNLPLSALAGVLIVTAYRMNDWENIKQYFSKRLKGPILKFLVTMVATVVFDLTFAIILGIGVALAVFVVNVSGIQITVSKVENGKMHRNSENVEEPCKNSVVVYVAGPVFFVNSRKLIKKLESVSGYSTVILSIRGVPLVDASAISALIDYHDRCISEGIRLIVCGAQEKVLERLKTYEFYDKLGEGNFYFSVDRVITHLCACNV